MPNDNIIINKERKPKINKDCGHINRDKKGNPTNWEEAKKWGYKKRKLYYDYSGGSDPLGIEEARFNKSRTLEIDTKSDLVIDKFLMNNNPTDLMGKKVWAINSKKQTFCGWIVDCYPMRYLLCKINGENKPFAFKDVIAMGESPEHTGEAEILDDKKDKKDKKDKEDA